MNHTIGHISLDIHQSFYQSCYVTSKKIYMLTKTFGSLGVENISSKIYTIIVLLWLKCRFIKKSVGYMVL